MEAVQWHIVHTYKHRTHWLRFRQDGTQEIYFRVPSKTTPTTILVAVIKAHRNRKTNLNPLSHKRGYTRACDSKET